MSGDLVCSKITKRYPNGAMALRSVSFRIPTSGIFSLIGRNGAGKTTLIRILATELLQTSGSASINGMDVLKEPEKVRESIAIVPQEARVLMWTTPRQMVVSYLMYRGYGLAEANKRAADALARVRIGKYIDTPSQRLSGGTKRKVLVATVLASEANILFLDEPTTGLDPISRAELWSLLKELKKDHFIFLTTHYLEEAERLADLIGIIEDGKLLALGSLAQLRKKVKHEFSVTVLDKDVKVKPRDGEVITGLDGNRQILTSDREANRISKLLMDRGVKFSSGPVSLEEIFYYLVRRPITEESGEEEGGWYGR